MTRARIITLSCIACFSVPIACAQSTNPMLNNGLSFINTPYAANTLDVSDEEELIINCDEVDCTTFVEYTLAMSLCADQGNDMQESEFAYNLQKIRYRNGKIDGYASRLHYVTDWINDNIKKRTIEDITAKESKEMTTVHVNYMSAHPEKYKHLKQSPENTAKMAAYEKRISGQKVSWLPKRNIPAEGLFWIQNGDIITFVTNTPGLDISHMGIAIYIKGNLHLLHASSKEKKVIVERLSLNEQLKSNKNVTGIRVLRMRNVYQE